MPLELKYLAIIESALIPKAKSKVGASGLWQFMYGTGKLYGLKVTSFVDDRRDPYKSTVAACRHMKDLYKIYNDWLLVLAAYNSGPGNVNKAIRRSGGKMNFWQIKPYLPRETQGYVPAFIAVNYVINYATEHNIYPIAPAFMHYEIDTVAVKDVVSFDQISEKLNIPREDIDFLNPCYMRGIIPSTKDETYYLRLPQKYIADFINNETALYQYTTSKGVEREKLLSLLKNAPASERIFHKVKNGETLAMVAKRYGCSMGDLKRWNHLRKSYIKRGQRLVVYREAVLQDSPSLDKDPSQVAANNRETVYHTVISGEHLAVIASQYKCSVKDIIVWNDLKETTIHPGQQLIVSGPAPIGPNQKSQQNITDSTEKQLVKERFTHYTVQIGDTLWGIANKYPGVTVNQIKQINNILNSNQLKPGQKIKIPVVG
jgi:membrane-bound lytic murein transglycosylase D